MKCIQCQEESELIICDPCVAKFPSEDQLLKSCSDILAMLVHMEYRKIQKAGTLNSMEGALLAQVTKPWDAYMTLKTGAANDEMVTSIEDHFKTNE